MKTISVNIPQAFLNGLEELVQNGLYANRSEAIRVAVRDLLKRELYQNEYSYERPVRTVSESEIKTI